MYYDQKDKSCQFAFQPTTGYVDELQDGCYFNINNLVIGNGTGTDVDNGGVSFSLFDGFLDWFLLIAAGASLLLFILLCACISRDKNNRIEIQTTGLRSSGTSKLHQVAEKSGETKYLVPILFLANFIGIIVMMVLEEEMSPAQAILCWFFLL